MFGVALLAVFDRWHHNLCVKRLQKGHKDIIGADSPGKRLPPE